MALADAHLIQIKVGDEAREADSEPVFHIPTESDSSMFSCWQIMLNTAIGSGTLMVPYCYMCGFGLSILVSALFGLLAYLALRFMIEAGQAAKTYDYHGLFEYCFGKKHMWIVDVMITLVQVGTLMIYCHWNGRLVNFVIDLSSKSVLLGSDTFWVFLITTFVVFPLTLFRHISKLEWFAVLSSVFIVILILHAMYYFFRDIKEFKDKSSEFRWFSFTEWKVIISCFSVNCMAFNCHINLFSCLGQLENCTV